MTQPTPYSSAVVPSTTPMKTNVLAIIAMIAAIVLPFVGVVLGIIASVQIRRSGERGGVLAIVAIVVGILLTILGILALIVATTFFGSLFCWGASPCVV